VQPLLAETTSSTTSGDAVPDLCTRCWTHPGRHRAVDATGSHPLCEFCVIAVLSEVHLDGHRLTLVLDRSVVRTA